MIDNDRAIAANKRRVEVEDDVDEEDDVDDGVDDQKSDVFVVERSVDGKIVRDHNHGVKGQAQDDPIPGHLKV